MSYRSKIVAVLAATAVMVVAQTSHAQGRGGGFMRGGGSLRLLQDEKVQGELEITDDQMDDLTSMTEDFREEMMDTFRDFRSLSEEERQELMEGMQERAKEIEEEAKAVLLPHQVDRLTQLNFQRNTTRGGTIGLAENDSLIEALDISEEQQEQMREAAVEASAKLEEKIASLRQQAQDEVLAVLTEEQRTTYNELMGDTFEFSQNRGWGGQRGGQRGGGDRGQRGGGERGQRGGGERGQRGGGERGQRGGGEQGGDDKSDEKNDF